MRKAAQKTSPVSLGTKRTCPDCATKFYDLNKTPPVCPKCEAKVDPNATNAVPRTEPKKPAKSKEIPEEALLESEDLVVGGSEASFEDLDELDDEGDDVVEDLEVEEEEQGDF